MTKLIIAEKYKVARRIAQIVGASNQNTQYKNGFVGYFESPDGEWICTWAAGHVIRMLMPDDYDSAYKRWSLDSLPIEPSQWKYAPSKGDPAKSQWSALKKLLKRTDIDTIYHACDADREGEMIGREIIRESGTAGKRGRRYLRIWYTNTTDAALKRALDEAKPLSDYDDLGAAADCRQKIDWLFGVNMTRAYTVMAGETRNVGRVVSPTINLIVERQAEIDGFIPEEYAIVKARLRHQNGDFTASMRCDGITTAENVKKAITGRHGVIEAIDKKTERTSRKLYNTTRLQSDASKLFGYEPESTMKTLQTLYDKGWITYPRTKATSINPEQLDDTASLLPEALSKVLSKGKKSIAGLDIDAGRIVVKKGSSDAEASHTGLLPTMNGIRDYASEMKNEDERIVFVLITGRMVCACLPPRIMDKSKVSINIDGNILSASGSVEISAGFHDVEKEYLYKVKNMPWEVQHSSGRRVSEDNDDEASMRMLPGMSVGDDAECLTAECERKQTKPPSQYTTASLLSTMENISRIVDDKKMKEMLKDAGLGTASSRDTVLKTIKSNGYVTSSSSGELHPTEKAKSLMSLLPEDLKSPVLTGKMELMLDDIACGRRDENDVLDTVTKRVEQEISDAKEKNRRTDKRSLMTTTDGAFKNMRCPVCGASIYESKKALNCTAGCGFVLWKSIAKKRLPKSELKNLLKDGVTSDKIDGLTSKKGKKFSCWIYIDDDGKTQFDFSRNGDIALSTNIKH